MQSSMNHQDNIRFDVARGVAAIVVLVAHVHQVFIGQFFSPTSPMEIVSGWAARAAVLVFFLLSGLLITKSIVSNIAKNGTFEPVDYLQNRIARLYPPLLFAIVLTIAVVITIQYFGLPGSNSPLGTVRPSGISITMKELGKALILWDGLTVPNGPLWTLYIEAKLYVVAMGVAMIVRGQDARSRAIGFVLILVALLLGSGHYKFWFFAAVWAFGALLNAPAMRSTRVFCGVAFCFIVGSWLSPVSNSNYIDNPAGQVWQTIGVVVAGYALLLKNWGEFRFPAWLQKTGGFSYTLYVIHFPLLLTGLSLSIHFKRDSFSETVTTALICASVILLLSIAAARPLENVRFYKGLLKRYWPSHSLRRTHDINF